MIICTRLQPIVLVLNGKFTLELVKYVVGIMGVKALPLNYVVISLFVFSISSILYSLIFSLLVTLIIFLFCFLY